MRIAAALSLALALSVTVRAQEGATILPKNYRVQFENAWVKITAVRYEPMQKLPAHAHTPNPSVYVYLNDGPAVTFSHVGGKPATRPATRAGAFRIYRGLQEVHEVENTGSVASEFLRVELKTEGREPGSFWGKYERGAPSSEPTVHFSHAQVRISRLWLPPGQTIEISTATEPALIVALQSGGGYHAGEERWLDRSSATTLSNSGAAPIDFLRFDLKTPPAASTR